MERLIVPFIPGRRPTDEELHPGLGSSDKTMLVTGDDAENRAIILFNVPAETTGAVAHATATLDGTPLPGWDRRPIELTGTEDQRIELRPSRDLADVDLSLRQGFIRRIKVELTISSDDSPTLRDETWLDACDARNLGSLYERIIDRVVARDTARQAEEEGVMNPGVAYHPWYPVLKIGGDKADLYNAALIADIVHKEHHLTDPGWLLRVGVYLELLTCVGIFDAVKDDVGDVLEPEERAAIETGPAFEEMRAFIDADAWAAVWRRRRISFPTFGSPRTGPVAALNLLRKKEATLRFLHVHHEDLKHAIELAGANHFNSQETWQRVFRDAERAVLRQTAAAFPEIRYIPETARDILLWQSFGFAGQEGIYPTACNQYRASMNAVATWAKERGLMDHAGSECVPEAASLLRAYENDRDRIPVLQRQDGFGPDLTVNTPAMAPKPTVDEIEAQLRTETILEILTDDEIHELAVGARPLLLGPTQRFVVQGQEGTSLFLVGEGHVEVRLRKDDGTDWLVETMGPGEIVGEMGLLTGGPRSATVRSVEEAVVYELSKDLYAPLLAAHPGWKEDLSEVMQERLARRRSRLAEVEAASARNRSLLNRVRRGIFDRWPAGR